MISTKIRINQYSKAIVSIFLLSTTLIGCNSLPNTVISPPTNPSIPQTPKSATAISVTTLEQTVLEQVNQYRKQANLAPLRLNSIISEQARIYSQNLAHNSGNNPNHQEEFETRSQLIKNKIPYQQVTANLSISHGYRDPATQAVQNWLKQTEYRQNIEGDFELTGIGIAQNQGGEYYITQIFVKTLPNLPLTTLEQQIHQQVNQYRQSRNLPPLRLNSIISQEARKLSQAMATGEHTFSHDGFEQRVANIAKKLRYRSAAENLAYNYGQTDPATAAVKGWIGSPGHHLNMIGDFNLTGIGAAQNARGEYYFTQLFILEP